MFPANLLDEVRLPATQNVQVSAVSLSPQNDHLTFFLFWLVGNHYLHSFLNHNLGAQELSLPLTTHDQSNVFTFLSPSGLGSPPRQGLFLITYYPCRTQGLLQDMYVFNKCLMNRHFFL